MFKHYFSIALLIISMAACADSTAEAVITNKVKALMPNMPVDSVTRSQIPGLYAVASGGNVLYMSENGQYLVQGELYDVKNTADIVNLTTETRKVGIKRLINTLMPADLIVFKAPEEKTYITVFTDIDCGYCHALQKEVPALNAAGITVRYAAFPRSDKGTPSYDKAISVWCAKNRNAAYEAAMSGGNIASLTCQNHPVDKTKSIGEAMGIGGTPAIVFQNGRLTPGYLPAKQMIDAVYTLGM